MKIIVAVVFVMAVVMIEAIPTPPDHKLYQFEQLPSRETQQQQAQLLPQQQQEKQELEKVFIFPGEEQDAKHQLQQQQQQQEEEQQQEQEQSQSKEQSQKQRHLVAERLPDVDFEQKRQQQQQRHQQQPNREKTPTTAGIALPDEPMFYEYESGSQEHLESDEELLHLSQPVVGQFPDIGFREF